MAFTDQEGKGLLAELYAQIRAGRVLIERGSNVVTIRPAPPPAIGALAGALEALRVASLASYSFLARELDVSVSSVGRALRGETLPSWPTVRAMVVVMGGDGDEFKLLYLAAKAERLQRRRE